MASATTVGTDLKLNQKLSSGTGNPRLSCTLTGIMPKGAKKGPLLAPSWQKTGFSPVGGGKCLLLLRGQRLVYYEQRPILVVGTGKNRTKPKCWNKDFGLTPLKKKKHRSLWNHRLWQWGYSRQNKRITPSWVRKGKDQKEGYKQ